MTHNEATPSSWSVRSNIKFSLTALARWPGLRYSIIRGRMLQRKVPVIELVSKCEDQFAVNTVVELRLLENPGNGKWREFGK